MPPMREVAFVLMGALLGALIGWVAAAAMHQSRLAGILVGSVIGIGVGIWIWRYLSQRARLKGMTSVKVHDSVY